MAQTEGRFPGTTSVSRPPRGRAAAGGTAVRASSAWQSAGMRSRPSDEALLERALVVAKDAPASGDVPVGAVIVDAEGRELAAAANAREALGDPTAHAEILALRQAAAVHGEWRLEGCTLAVTVEPCTMCAGAIVLARISRVIFGAWEPKTGAAGSLWDVLRDRRLTHRPEVVGGVREQEAAALLERFFTDHRT